MPPPPAFAGGLPVPPPPAFAGAPPIVFFRPAVCGRRLRPLACGRFFCPPRGPCPAAPLLSRRGSASLRAVRLPRLRFLRAAAPPPSARFASRGPASSAPRLRLPPRGPCPAAPLLPCRGFAFFCPRVPAAGGLRFPPVFSPRAASSVSVKNRRRRRRMATFRARRKRASLFFYKNRQIHLKSYNICKNIIAICTKSASQMPSNPL